MKFKLVAALVVIFALGLAGVFLLFFPAVGPTRNLPAAGDAARGEYLIRVGGCVACHTDIANQGDYLAGGPGLKTDFGTFYPPNITPDPQTGIGNWTMAEFSAALSDGKGPGLLEHLYPSFPYDSYTYLTDQDMADLYAGIMAVEPVSNQTPPHDLGFPFNFRPILAGWKLLFFKPDRLDPVAGKSEAWNRGRYLAWGPAHCVACHTPRNALGGRDDSRPFEGSTGTPGGNVPAITKAALEEEGYDHELFIEAMVSGFTPGFDVLGGAMGEVIAESMSEWNDDDLDALATYLLDLDE